MDVVTLHSVFTEYADPSEGSLYENSRRSCPLAYFTLFIVCGSRGARPYWAYSSLPMALLIAWIFASTALRTLSRRDCSPVGPDLMTFVSYPIGKSFGAMFLDSFRADFDESSAIAALRDGSPNRLNSARVVAPVEEGMALKSEAFNQIEHLTLPQSLN